MKPVDLHASEAVTTMPVGTRVTIKASHLIGQGADARWPGVVVPIRADLRDADLIAVQLDDCTAGPLCYSVHELAVEA